LVAFGAFALVVFAATAAFVGFTDAGLTAADLAGAFSAFVVTVFAAGVFAAGVFTAGVLTAGVFTAGAFAAVFLTAGVLEAGFSMAGFVEAAMIWGSFSDLVLSPDVFDGFALEFTDVSPIGFSVEFSKFAKKPRFFAGADSLDCFATITSRYLCSLELKI